MTTAPNKHLLDKLLSSQSKGWKIDLFQKIEDDYICVACHNVCKQAVALDCIFENEADEHKDDEIQLYCEICLKQILSDNNNICPISNHSDPVPRYTSNRLARRHILRALVFCPYSVQFQQHLKEGQSSSSAPSINKPEIQNIHDCQYIGNLGNLIEEHIHECIEKHFKNSKNSIIANQSTEHLLQILNEKYIAQENELKSQKEIILKLKEEMNGLRENISIQNAYQNEINQNLKTQLRNILQHINGDANEGKENVIVSNGQLKIELSIHSFRNCFNNDSDSHPRNLLKYGSNDCYFSSMNCDFKNDEKDWIIFEMDSNSIPKCMKLRNYNNFRQGISSLQVMIGSADEWRKLHSNEVIDNIELQKENMQTFELNGNEIQDVILQKQWKCIKVEFITNHGSKFAEGCKFGCYEIQFYG